MNREDKIKAAMQKSREHFLAGLDDRINKGLISLVNYNLEELEKKELINFFHGLKGAGATLGFDSLASIAKEYEEKLESNINNKKEVILKSIDGLSKIYQEYQTLEEDKSVEVREEKKENKLKENEVLSNSQYTNLTNMGTILIIDDDVDLLDLLERVLRQYGYKILITPEPSEGLKILRENNVDLILLDISLPETDGFSLFETIRSSDFEQPIIFLSAKREVENKVKGLNLGADDYITKPFEMEELEARIERVLEKNNKFKDKIIKDELTGAYTKSYFRKRASEEKERFSRGDKKFSIAFLDLDNFKGINDNYGHLVGDKVLKGFSSFLQQSLRKIDQVYRFGGDEFLILFPETTADEAYYVVQRLKSNFEENKLENLNLEQEVPVDFSSGIAEMETQTESIEELLEKADQALYEVKQSTKGGVKINDEVKANQYKKRILIVDDENIIADLIQTRLSSLGYEIKYSNDGQNGIKMAADYQPDLMIVDLMMPKINGFELLRQLRDNNKTRHIKTIVLSSKSSDQDIDRCFNLGADDYLSKPFSLAELENRVKKLI